MKSDKNKTFFSKLPTYTIFFIILFTMMLKFLGNGWHKRVIEEDVISYYAYLPVTFIEKDIQMSFMADTSQDFTKKYWPRKLANGNYLIKTTMGMSFLYAPFFGLAHFIESSSGAQADGFSSAYRVAISFATLIYLLIGLILLRKFLLRYFLPEITSLSILLIYFASSLLYYSSYEPGVSHTYSFALISAFIYLTDLWLQNQKWKYSLTLAILLGIITLIRPSNVLILLFIPLWGVSNIKNLKQRFYLLLKNWPQLLTMAFLSISVWIPQMLYWKMQSGYYLFNSYNEGFYFQNFHIHKALFGFRKGWFIYSPVMLFAVAGIFFMKKKLKTFKSSILVFLIVFIYITFSWWCWWYGGCYGSRPMVDILFILAIPLASIMQKGFALNKKTATRIIAFIFIIHGLFQTLQYKNQVIHWDSMTKDAYFDALFRIKPSPHLQELIQTPDYENAIKGEKEELD